MSPSTCFQFKHFVSSGKQRLPLAGSSVLMPGDIVGVAHSPLVEVVLDDLNLSCPLSYEDPVVSLHNVHPSSEQQADEIPSPLASVLERLDD